VKRILVLVAAVHVALLAPCLAPAQSPPAKRAPAPAAAPPAEALVDIRDAFGLVTPRERWSLEDAMPNGSVDFGGKAVTFADRKVVVSAYSDGDPQLFYPVSWYEPYRGQSLDLKYVVVRYKGGKACSITAEYLPDRVSMPKESFQPHPDGKSFYSDVSTVRQNGHVYYKQAISGGREDGKGGLWVDMLVMSCAEDAAPAPKATASTRP
jgi:hypothetical protein